MVAKIYTDDEFIEAWKKYKSPLKISVHLGLAIRGVYERRRSIEKKYGLELKVADENVVIEKHSARIVVPIENGTVIVFSDAHFWDNNPSTAYKALIKLITELKPKLIVCNGDAFDGANVSRHGRIGFLESRPSVIQELDACREMLGFIAETAKANKNNVQLTWTLGNHDARFETLLAAQAPQYEFVDGFHLKDHFPEWKPCWSTWVNHDVCIKHRWKGGVHATHNNTLGSGVSMVTGHLHSLKVNPYTDYNGTRYGVDTGTLAEVNGDQFMNYTEDGPKNWRSGFAVLTFYKGKLLPPELVEVITDTEAFFRGKVYDL